MTKGELRTGMIVTYRIGYKRKVFLDTCFGRDILCGEDGWAYLADFNEDLTSSNHDMDIVMVENPADVSWLEEVNPQTKVIWERPVKKQYTYT